MSSTPNPAPSSEVQFADALVNDLVRLRIADPLEIAPLRHHIERHFAAATVRLSERLDTETRRADVYQTEVERWSKWQEKEPWIVENRDLLKQVLTLSERLREVEKELEEKNKQFNTATCAQIFAVQESRIEEAQDRLQQLEGVLQSVKADLVKEYETVDRGTVGITRHSAALVTAGLTAAKR